MMRRNALPLGTLPKVVSAPNETMLSTAGIVLLRWHSGYGDPIYKVGDNYVSGRTARGRKVLEEAISEAEKLVAGGLHPQDKKDLEYAIKIMKRDRDAVVSYHGAPLKYSKNARRLSPPKAQDLKRAGRILMEWNNGQGDPLYMVGSWYHSRGRYPDRSILESALSGAMRVLDSDYIHGPTEKRDVKFAIGVMERDLAAPGGAVDLESTGVPFTKNARGGDADEHAATELETFIDNDSSLSPMAPSGQGVEIAKNLLRKMKAGKYDPKLAPKLWGYLVETAAKKYAREFDDPKNWHQIFSPATRSVVAKSLALSFERAVADGEYSHLDTSMRRNSRMRRNSGEVVLESYDADEISSSLPSGDGHDGGYVIFNSSDGHPMLMAWDAIYDEGEPVTQIYQLDVADDTWADVGGTDWDWKQILRSVGDDDLTIERLREMGRSDSVAERAAIYELIASYHGWIELDNYPRTRTLFQMAKMLPSYFEVPYPEIDYEQMSDDAGLKVESSGDGVDITEWNELSEDTDEPHYLRTDTHVSWEELIPEDKASRTKLWNAVGGRALAKWDAPDLEEICVMLDDESKEEAVVHYAMGYVGYNEGDSTEIVDAVGD